MAEMGGAKVAEPHGYTVHYSPSWEGRPFLAEAACKHDPVCHLVMGVRIIGKGGKSGVTCDAHICTDCGKVLVGEVDFVEAMKLAWAEYGWNRIIGERLYGLVAHCKGVRWGVEVTWVPIWFAHAIGMTGKQIAKALARAHGQMSSDGRFRSRTVTAESTP